MSLTVSSETQVTQVVVRVGATCETDSCKGRQVDSKVRFSVNYRIKELGLAIDNAVP